jgi:haloalkane dehalogenase
VPDIDVLDSHMHYEEAGTGNPIVLLHGNPTSSYLWRSVVPELSPARAVPGSGPDRLRPLRQAEHRLSLLRSRPLPRRVGHDWGGALGFDWAARHPDRVRGIAIMETYVRPQTWAEWQPPEARDIFQAFRSSQGEQLILDQNLFVELVLPAGMQRTLSKDEMAVYRAPFQEREARRPMLAFPRDLPIEGEPPDVVARIEAYSDWLVASTEVPKLLLTFDPGGVMTEPVVAWCREHIAALEVQGVGPGTHYVREDHGLAIGKTIAAWMRRHRLVSAT